MNPAYNQVSKCVLFSISVVCPLREKKKEQERDEMWKQLDELRLSHNALVQNNSHGLQNVQNNNNNNNNNSNSNTENEDKSAEAAAGTTDNQEPDDSAEAGESSPGAK